MAAMHISSINGLPHHLNNGGPGTAIRFSTGGSGGIGVVNGSGRNDIVDNLEQNSTSGKILTTNGSINSSIGGNDKMLNMTSSTLSTIPSPSTLTKQSPTWSEKENSGDINGTMSESEV